MKIQTIRLPESKKIEVIETDLPGPAEGQVLVKTYQSSICGTDRNIYNGILPPGLKFPISMLGHEGEARSWMSVGGSANISWAIG